MDLDGKNMIIFLSLMNNKFFLVAVSLISKLKLPVPDDAKLGVIRLDYDYPAIPGDIDSPESFGYEVVYRTVPGLTFEMAQSGR